MNLKHLNDQTLLSDIKILAHQECALLTKVLYHLKEIEERKLYSTLGYKNIYDYAASELKYSADQTYRRIAAMRLLKELPQLSAKIDSGALSLSNISQAQRFFNEAKSNNQPVPQVKKIEVLKELENSSVREAQIKILALSPVNKLPAESRKQITPTQTQVNFLMSESLETKLEEIRSLLGPKSFCSLAELVELMADLSLPKLKEKKFGKKRTSEKPKSNEDSKSNQKTKNIAKELSSLPSIERTKDLEDLESIEITKDFEDLESIGWTKDSANLKLIGMTKDLKNLDVKIMSLKPSKKICAKKVLGKSIHPKKTKSPKRYISVKVKHEVWQKNCGQCMKCRSKRNLNFDHIKPFALGGSHRVENLRLLCFSCNQRQRMEAKL